MPDVDSLNENVTFLPQVEEGERPCMVVGGVQVYAYFESGELCVSVDYEGAVPQVRNEEGVVPTRVALGGEGDVYGRERVSEAVNEGADTILDALDLGERDRDLVNLAVNAGLECLDRPGATFEEVVEANFTESPDEIRGWWDW